MLTLVGDVVREFVQLFSGLFVWLTVLVVCLTLAAGFYQLWRVRRHGSLSPARQRALQQWSRRITSARWIGFALMLLVMVALAVAGYQQAAFLLLVGWVCLTMLLRWLAAMLTQWGRGSA